MILVVLLLLTHLSSVLLARYLTGITPSSVGKVGSFHGGVVSHKEFAVAGITATEDPHYYVFQADISAIFYENAVKRKYSLKIYLDPATTTNVTSLACPASQGSNAPYSTKDIGDADFSSTTLSDMTGGGLTGSFTEGIIYYAKVDGDSYTWYSSSSNIITLAEDIVIGAEETTHTYSFLFFISAHNTNNSNGELIQDKVNILYDLSCEQVN
ncbi:MAG: hypothetical protein IJY24_07415 [Clostridia bacterium]|nr:hypothetical protein [Clostridia bacterium]